jgi:hypothetical protein
MSKQVEQIIFKEAARPMESYIYDEADETFFSEEVQEGPEGLIGAIVSLDDAPSEDDLSKTLKEVLEPMAEGDESFGSLSEELESLDEDVTELIEDFGDVTLGDLLPGSDVRAEELEDDVEEKETDYENDGDLTKFMEYISDQYPGKIPQHDGRTTVGCERALSFLDRVNSDISRAIRDDRDNALDIQALEDVRVNIIRDTMVLKDHLNKLKKKLKEAQAKQAAAKLPPTWAKPSGESVEYNELVKEARTPNNIVITMTPFERAITGMMVNAHISGGHPIEDVYEFLKKKYDLTEREELAMMQICMDSGFPIFKDRGTYSEELNDEEGKGGVDFLKNYFA